MDLSKLVSIPPRTVYGFFNHQTKVCQIFYSSNTLPALAKQVDDYRHIITKDGLEVNIIETCPGDPRLRHYYWCVYYKAKGYKFYKNPRGLTYKLKYELGENPFGTGFLWYVYLENKVPQRIIVGVFEKHHHMRAFIKQSYPKRNIYQIVCDSSDLTKKVKEFHER